MQDFNITESRFNKTTKYSAYYSRYFNRLRNLVMARFEWINLPEEIPPKFIEDVLFWFGNALFFKDDAIGLFAVTKNCLGGTIDNYNTPNQRMAYAVNYFKFLNKSNSVIIWDSLTDYPMSDYVAMYADSLANMRLTRDINVFAQRTPIVFAGQASQQLTIRNLFKQYNDFIPFIPVKDGITNIDNLKVLNTDAPIVFDKLEVLMKQEISDFCTLTGICHTDSSKKERLVSVEAKGDFEETLLNRSSFLRVRKRACEQINRIFGLNVDVRFVEENLNVEDGEENGTFYD